MKKLFFTGFLWIITTALCSQPSIWAVKFSNSIISRYQPTINTMTLKGWEYSNSIVLHGIEKVYQFTRDAAYLDYIKAYIDNYVSANGTVTGLGTTLDKIHPGLLCLFLYKETGQIKYKTAATNIRNYLIGTAANPSLFHKTPDGGYWHKNDGNYNNIMMLDGIYMAHPFLAKYGSMFHDTISTNTAIFQTLLLASHVYDSNEQLVKHAWNYYRSSVWSNPSTGASSEVWSRGLGWYTMALVDILRYIPVNHPRYNELVNLLNDLCIGIKDQQDHSTGLWYQVVDKPDSAGNYIEASGSGMLVYALKTAVDHEWIDTSYLTVARKGWDGLQNYISTYTDGGPRINSFTPAMGVQNNYTAYANILPANCPAAFGTQHPHGYCGILMASSAMEFPITTYTFIGDGHWNTATNWSNNTIPPMTLPATTSIVIDPVSTGKCSLNGIQHIAPGASLILKHGKKLVIEGNLIIQ